MGDSLEERFSHFNTRKAKPEHLSAVRHALSDGSSQTPRELAAGTALTETAVRCALDVLEANGELTVVRQLKSPKAVASLKRPPG